jgi:hypothetical protein
MQELDCWRQKEEAEQKRNNWFCCAVVEEAG